MSGLVYHFHTVGGDSLEQTPPTSSIDDVDGIMYEAELRILDDTPPLDLNFDLICDSNTYKVSQAVAGGSSAHSQCFSWRVPSSAHSQCFSWRVPSSAHSQCFSWRVPSSAHSQCFSWGGYPRVHIASVSWCIQHAEDCSQSSAAV